MSARNSHYETIKAEFDKQLAVTNNYREAFEKAQENTYPYYSSYESFKRQRSKKRKK